MSEIVRQSENSEIIKLATKIRTKIANKNYTNLREIFDDSKDSKEIEFFTDENLFIKNFYQYFNWYKEDKILTSYTNSNVDYFNNIIRIQFWKERGNDNPECFLPKDIIRFKKQLNFVDFPPRNDQVLYQNGEEVIIDTAELIYDENYQLKFWMCTVVGRKKDDFFRVLDLDSLAKFKDILNNHFNLALSEKYPHNKERWRRFFRLRDSFADIQYVFAATTHKLQGSTYDTVYIDLASLINNKYISDDLRYRLAYVAITRARKNIKIFY